MSTTMSEVRPSAIVTWWRTILPSRILPSTWLSEAREANSYSPAFSLRAAPVVWAAVRKIEDERITPACSRLEAISGRLAPRRRTTLVTSPERAGGPGPW
jgi:hypothetical protein